VSDFGQKLRFTLTNDTLFKIVYSRNPELLKALLAILLQRDIAAFADFEVINAEVAPQFPGGKSTRRDLLVRVRVRVRVRALADYELIDVEVQNEATPGFVNRVVFYASDLYARSLHAGEPYTTLPKVTVVVILGETLFPGGHYATRLTLSEHHRVADLVRQGDLQGAAAVLAVEPSDRLDLRFFELTKVPGDVAARPSDYRDRPDWAILVVLSVFKALTQGDLRAIEELGVAAVAMTIEALREALADGQIRELLHQEELARAEEKFVRTGYFEKGEAKGRAEGRADALLELIAIRYSESSEPTAETERTVREGTDDQVREWTARILHAKTVAELLADSSGPERDER
jgi:predicted transposase/invertase (TIGR01784 family)